MINFGFSGMLVTPKIAALGSLFLLLFSGLSLASPYSSSEVRDDQNQHPLTSSPLVEGWHNFSVGFSLQSSYGAAAVIFTWPDGRLETHTTVFYGGPEYNEVMARLSLASSQHLAPPYDDDGEYWADQPRKAARTALKLVGLPASYEVGVLANVIYQLRTQLERAFAIHISEAVFTASHLLALYQDDLRDAAAHHQIRYVRPRRTWTPLVWETSSAYAGHGRGLCDSWWNDTECAREGVRDMRDIPIMSVHYSRTALTVTLSTIYDALGLWEPDYRHAENFSLGQDAVADYVSEEQYWEAVQRHLLIIMEEYTFAKPELIMITGESANEEFMEYLKKAMIGHMGKVPKIISDEPTVVAAKGAAEFMRRGPYPWRRVQEGAA